MTASTPPQSSLAVESLRFAGRRLVRWRRQPILPIQALLFPTLLLITYNLLVGKSILRITGTDSLYGLVPMCALAGAMFGALGAGVAVTVDRDTGLLTRLWTLPVRRASALVGTLLAEAGRTLCAAVLITAVGVALGLRFEGGWFGVIPFLLVPVLVGVVFATVVIAIAVRVQDNVLITWIATGAIGLVFASSGAASVEAFPSWLQPLIHLQPMSPTIESMRAFAQGGPVLWPLMQSFVWILGVAAVSMPLAVRGYRAAAESW
jgi:ABC-2 type transport system permease protein